MFNQSLDLLTLIEDIQTLVFCAAFLIGMMVGWVRARILIILALSLGMGIALSWLQIWNPQELPAKTILLMAPIFFLLVFFGIVELIALIVLGEDATAQLMGSLAASVLGVLFISLPGGLFRRTWGWVSHIKKEKLS